MNRNLPSRPLEVSHLPVPVTPSTFAPGSPHEPVFLITVVRKRWLVLLISLIVSCLVAVGVAHRFTRQTFKSKGSLLYSGLPASAGGRVYQSPSIATHGALLASHTNLGRLIEKHGLELGPIQLERRVKVNLGRAATIDVNFTWNDEKQAVELLADLMEIFIEDVVRRRSETIDAHIRHMERMLLASTSKVDEAAERRRARLLSEGDSMRSNKLIERELGTLSAGVETIKTSLENAELRKIGLETEFNALTARGEQLDEWYAEQRAKLQASYKQQLLSEVRGRYEEALKNYGPKSLARNRLQKVGQELDAIAAAIDQDHDLRDWTMQLREIDNIITPNTKLENFYDRYADDPFKRESQAYQREIERIESRQRDLQMNLLVNEQGIKLMQARLAKKEAELGEKTVDVSTTSDYAQRLDAEFKEANAERMRIRHQLSGLRQLEECRVREFSVSTPTYLASVDSNTNKLFVMTLFFTMMVLSAPVFVREYFANKAVTVEQTGRKFGLPVLARGSLASQVVEGTLNFSTSDDDALRLLALRIQQSISQPGSTVLFSGLDHGESTFPLLCGLARCFSERDERVLILDAGKSIVANDQQLKNLFGELQLPQVQHTDRGQEKVDTGGAPRKNGASSGRPTNGSTDLSEAQNGNMVALSGGPKGLSDYLTREDMTPSEIIMPTRLSGVDCICSGSRPFPVEGLATRRMSDLFDGARKQYGLVLVAGPPSHHLADLQLLAARADGILFTVTQGQSLTVHSQEVLQEMMDLDAPIIGIVG